MIYLASKSPRRKELLKKTVKDFVIAEADVKETEDQSMSPVRTALHNAVIKAEYVFARRGGIVIAADTVVALGKTMLFKPANPEEARYMLKLLSGKTHRVITGVCVIGKGRYTAAVTSYVTFNNLSPQFIEDYINSGKCYDKAGGYGIQDSPRFCKRLQGSRSNVIGLPVKTAKRLLMLAADKL